MSRYNACGMCVHGDFRGDKYICVKKHCEIDAFQDTSECEQYKNNMLHKRGVSDDR